MRYDKKHSILWQLLLESRVSREATLIEIHRCLLKGMNAEQIGARFGIGRPRFQSMMEENRDLAVTVIEARAQLRKAGVKVKGARRKPYLRPACETCRGSTFCTDCDGWRRRLSDGQPCDCNEGQCRKCGGTGYALEGETECLGTTSR